MFVITTLRPPGGIPMTSPKRMSGPDATGDEGSAKENMEEEWSRQDSMTTPRMRLGIIILLRSSLMIHELHSLVYVGPPYTSVRIFAEPQICNDHDNENTAQRNQILLQQN
nr:hypothetical protein CFP56_42136 [Quercus suber]